MNDDEGEMVSYGYPDNDPYGWPERGEGRGSFPRTVRVHCSYKDCDALIEYWESGRKEVSCEKGMSCPKYPVACPFVL